MKKQKKIKKLRSAGAVLLCCIMILSFFSFVSCENLIEFEGQETQAGQENQDGQEGGGTLEKTESVVRVRKGLLAGKQIAGEHLEIAEVPVSSIPEGAIKTTEEVIGKYAAIDIVRGEFVFDRMLLDEKPLEDNSNITYIVVSDKLNVGTGNDMAEALQDLIDSSAGRTLYFTDGVYNISKPIKLPANKEKAVSLRFSNYAVLKATDNWNSEDAMICVGASNELKSEDIAEVAVMGGTVDGSGKAKVGISLENCANSLVNNLTFIGCKSALQIKATASSANIDGFTVKGDGSADSYGIINESNGSVFATGNIANVCVGIKNSGKNNEFRNISVSAAKNVSGSKGFYENGTQNGFSLCTAEDFTNGFFIKGGAKSVFEACNAVWSGANVTEQSAFVIDGVFSSTISSCTVRFFDATSTNALIKYGSVSGGIIKLPIFDETLCDNDSYKSVLAGSVIWVN